MAWQRIASLSEIAVDAVLGVDVDGSRVALYRLARSLPRREFVPTPWRY